MTARRPLVRIGGRNTQLPDGDTLAGLSGSISDALDAATTNDDKYGTIGVLKYRTNPNRVGIRAIGKKIGTPITDLTGTTDYLALWNYCVSAAKNGAFALVVDCKVLLDVYNDATKCMFFDNGVHIDFEEGGELILTNNHVPSFAMVHCLDLVIRNLKARWVGSLSTTPNPFGSVNGYEGLFNDTVLRNWLRDNRGITWSSGCTPCWPGQYNIMAMFQVGGDTELVMEEPSFYVPDGVTADQFLPFVFNFGVQPKPNTAVTVNPQGANILPATCIQNRRVELIRPTLDGVLMGLVGSPQNLTVRGMRSRRYSDLQDADGSNPGGVDSGSGPWFPPPHAFYFTYLAGDALIPNNITITQTIDEGIYVGGATVRSSGSGFLNSLKIGGSDITVDDYQSYRPHGFLDFLEGTRVHLSKLKAVFDSTNTSIGIRFPTAIPLVDCSMRNVDITDLAPAPKGFPISGSTTQGNSNFQCSDVRVTLQDRTTANGTGPAGFTMAGSDHILEYQVTYKAFSSTSSFIPITSALNTSTMENCSVDVIVNGWRPYGGNYSGSLQPRILATNGLGNTIRVRDRENSYEALVRGRMKIETVNLKADATPTAGASYPSGVVIPGGFKTLRKTGKVAATFSSTTGLSGIKVGVSGDVAGLGAVTNVTFNNPASQFGDSEAYPAASGDRPVLLTADGGTFDGLAVGTSPAVPSVFRTVLDVERVSPAE